MQLIWRLPSCVHGFVLRKFAKTWTQDFTKGGCSQGYVDAVVQYLALVWSMPTPIDIAQVMVSKSPCHARHSMLAEDRLGNPATFGIPIAMAFGEQDFLQSEGAAETIIKRH